MTGILASNNNRSSTVYHGVFQESTAMYGFPSRVRGDHGGENIDVATEMILRRGTNRGSFIWGAYVDSIILVFLSGLTKLRSTRNTRIEWLWVEVGTQFARRWRAFFLRLQNLHYLDPEDQSHLWLLHFLFLEDINADCRAFRDEWNAHPISGLGHGRSPNVIVLFSDNCIMLSLMLGPSASWTTRKWDLC